VGVCALLWVGGGSALAAGHAGAGTALALAALGDLGIFVACRRLQPVAYRIDADALLIERRGAPARRFAGHVSGPRRLSLRVRLFGSGGLGGYLGVYGLGGGGRALAFVTDRSRAVVLTVGERQIAISPAEPIGGSGA